MSSLAGGLSAWIARTVNQFLRPLQKQNACRQLFDWLRACFFIWKLFMFMTNKPSPMAGRWRRLLVSAMSIAALVVSTGACAYGTMTGTISGIYVNESLGSFAYITMNGTKSANPSCSTGPYSFVLSLTNGDAPQLFAMLLTARTTQMDVTLTGDGACDLVSGVETLWVVSY